MSKRSFILLSVVVFVSAFTACRRDNDDFNRNNRNDSEDLSALPENIQYPNDNPYSLEKENLGQLLFWDPILSGRKDIACATCHHPDFGYADGLDLSQGVNGTGLGPGRANGERIQRNSPTILNTAFNGIDNSGNYRPERAPMFWDLSEFSLENQALKPMLSKEEMRGDNISENAIMDTVIQRLNSIAEYQTLFQAAFGSTQITQDRVLKAIATFERGLVANNSRFDQFMRGEEDALSNFELEGMETFLDAGCGDCHNGAMLSDFELHTLGVPNHRQVNDRGANGDFDFRTPTLRNVELTAPYMHNGVFRTLEDVVEFYEDVSDGRRNAINNQLNRNQLDDDVRDLRLGRRDIDEIVAFLKTLTDRNFDRTIPSSVPSNLPVGGNID